MSTWTIDQSHSLVAFSAKHMMISTVRGRFEQFEGSVELDEADPAGASVEVHIETASVNTDWHQRDEHLRSNDFFDAATYPLMTFHSTSVEPVGDGRARVHGDLTIKDVTRPVMMDVELIATVNGLYGERRAAFEANTTINREDFGLTWNMGLETGGVLVSKEISIALEITVTQPLEASVPAETAAA